MIAVLTARAQISTPNSLTGAAVTQDFNSLANSSTSATTPQGWGLLEAGTSANTSYAAGTGSGSSGDTYSFGATGSNDRAFGTLQSGSNVPIIGAAFTNNTGLSITTLTINYTGEQWRLGATGRADRLDFQYSTNATNLATTGATWIDADAGDFSSPITTGTVGALDGNAAANRTAINFTISGLNIPNGSTFFIRWTDFNASGADDGLGIDDFQLAFTTAAVVNTASVAAGANAAEPSTNGTFTVSLNNPAPAGGVVVNYTLGGSASLMADYSTLR